MQDMIRHEEDSRMAQGISGLSFVLFLSCMISQKRAEGAAVHPLYVREEASPDSIIYVGAGSFALCEPFYWNVESS